MGIEYLVVLIFATAFIYFSLSYVVKSNAKNIAESAYEDRDFTVKKEVPMVGLFGVKFPDIKLYDLDRDEYGEIIENSPLYIEIAKWLLKEMKNADYGNRNFDINKIFINLNNKDSDSYRTYVHIMRVLTNVNFEAFVNKGMKYDFSKFNRDAMREIETHVDTTIVEIGTYMIEKIIEMSSSEE